MIGRNPRFHHEKESRPNVRFISGCLGAIFGVILGGIATVAFLSLAFQGNDIAFGMTLLILGPIGLFGGGAIGVPIGLRIREYLARDGDGAPSRARKAALIALVVLGIPGAIAGMFGFIRHLGTPTPFEQIVSMSKKDRGLTRVGDNWTLPDDPRTIGVSPQRIAACRRLFRKIDTPRGITVSESGDDIEFDYWGRGSAVSSDTTKGYLYTTKPPTPLLRSLDDCEPGGREIIQAYRHIRGNWYLFYEFLPG